MPGCVCLQRAKLIQDGRSHGALTWGLFCSHGSPSPMLCNVEPVFYLFVFVLIVMFYLCAFAFSNAKWKNVKWFTF